MSKDDKTPSFSLPPTTPLFASAFDDEDPSMKFATPSSGDDPLEEAVLFSSEPSGLQLSVRLRGQTFQAPVAHT